MSEKIATGSTEFALPISEIPDTMTASVEATPPYIAPVENIGRLRRLGESILRFFRSPEDAPTIKEAITPHAGRLAARIERATEAQQAKLTEQQRSGDQALEKSGLRLLTAEYESANARAESYGRLRTSFATRSRERHASGSLWGRLMGWANGALARFFGWRARAARDTRDYYLEGVVELAQPDDAR